MAYWILGVAAGNFFIVYMTLLLPNIYEANLMEVAYFWCSVLEDVSESIVSLVTEKGTKTIALSLLEFNLS